MRGTPLGDVHSWEGLDLGQSMKFGSHVHRGLGSSGFSCTQELGSSEGEGAWFVENRHRCGGTYGAGEGRCCGWGRQAVLLHLTQTPDVTLLSWRRTVCSLQTHSPSTQDSVPVEPNTSHSPEKFYSCLKVLGARGWAGNSLLMGGCTWQRRLV